MKPPTLPLIEDLPPGLEPWEAFLSLSALPGAIFLDSALRNPRLGTCSFVAADPFQTIRWKWGDPGNPLDLLEKGLSRCAAGASAGNGGKDPLPQLPPFRGGAAGLLGYGLSRTLEELPPFRHDEFHAPDLSMGLYDLVLAFDHGPGKGWIISQGFPELDPAARSRRARERIEEFSSMIRSPAPTPSQASARREVLRGGIPGPAALAAPAFEVPGAAGVLSDFSPAGYREAIERAIEWIRAGDIFQVNLAQRLIALQTGGAIEFYGKLRERNPAPFGGYLDLGDLAIASSSPERFLSLRGDLIVTRPIKGTRPRGRDLQEDEMIRSDLERSEKDRAENLMIVDLLRNDLSRVCRPSTVDVTNLFGIESYSTVHHLVSEVQGRLREGLGPIDLLRAAFPGGSVTGAPKVRALEIISELEPAARGAYCGSMGYIGFDGAMDMSILIRTATVGRGWIQFPAGGGITARSDPEKEYLETLDKAAGILRALEPAG